MDLQSTWGFPLLSLKSRSGIHIWVEVKLQSILGTFRHQDPKETEVLFCLNSGTKKEIYQAGPQFSTSQLHPLRIRLLARLCAPLDGEKIMKRVEREIKSISPILIPLGSRMGTLSHVWRCEMHSTKPSSVTKVEHSRVSEAKELRKWSIKLFEVQPLRNTRTSETSSARCWQHSY